MKVLNLPAISCSAHHQQHKIDIKTVSYQYKAADRANLILKERISFLFSSLFDDSTEGVRNVKVTFSAFASISMFYNGSIAQEGETICHLHQVTMDGRRYSTFVFIGLQFLWS